MKRNIFAASLIALFASLPAFAEDKRISIAFSFVATGPATFVGTFNMAGAVTESGSATADGATRVNDEGVLLLYSNKVLQLAGGDIYLFVEGPLTFPSEGALSVIGKWRLTGGTGVYADVKGHGHAAIVGDLNTGAVSGAYDGKINVK